MNDDSPGVVVCLDVPAFARWFRFASNSQRCAAGTTAADDVQVSRSRFATP